VAHGGSLEHEVFHKPFKVKPVYAERKTPGRYRDYPGGADLPDKMKVWLVQKTGSRSGGVISRSWGFNDSPDAEALVTGYNSGKEYGAVGIGRQGNYLQWGFWAPPSKMTEPGKRLFINCIRYIRQFDGKAPLIRRQQSDRINPVRLAMALPRINDRGFFRNTFTPEQLDKHAKNADGLIRYYLDNYEFIYHDGTYRIDEELKMLGISSNRTFDTLERLIGLLDNPAHTKVARRLLDRYTTEDFGTPAEWKRWLTENRERFYFSDVGGYKFRIIPKGYLELAQTPKTQPAEGAPMAN
jgi:hypothetical protein